MLSVYQEEIAPLDRHVIAISHSIARKGAITVGSFWQSLRGECYIIVLQYSSNWLVRASDRPTAWRPAWSVILSYI